MTPVADTYNKVLNRIGPLGIRAHPMSWAYQLMPNGTIRVICGDAIAVELTNQEIRFHLHQWNRRDGSLSHMPYEIRYNVKAGSKTAAKGRVYIVEYEGASVEIKDGGFAIYTDAEGLRANSPVVKRAIVADRRRKVIAHIRHALRLPFATAKVVGMTKGLDKFRIDEADVITRLVANDVQAINALADTSLVRMYVRSQKGFVPRDPPQQAINNFINRNMASIYEAFGVYEGMSFKEPPAA